MIGVFEREIPYTMELNPELTKDFKLDFVKFQPFADFAASTINALLIQEKFAVLAEFCKAFCNVTQHFYSSLVIPFMISAMTVLEEKAQNLTN